MTSKPRFLLPTYILVSNLFASNSMRNSLAILSCSIGIFYVFYWILVPEAAKGQSLWLGNGIAFNTAVCVVLLSINILIFQNIILMRRLISASVIVIAALKLIVHLGVPSFDPDQFWNEFTSHSIMMGLTTTSILILLGVTQFITTLKRYTVFSEYLTALLKDISFLLSIIGLLDNILGHFFYADYFTVNALSFPSAISLTLLSLAQPIRFFNSIKPNEFIFPLAQHHHYLIALIMFLGFLITKQLDYKSEQTLVDDMKHELDVLSETALWKLEDWDRRGVRILESIAEGEGLSSVDEFEYLSKHYPEIRYAAIFRGGEFQYGIPMPPELKEIQVLDGVIFDLFPAVEVESNRVKFRHYKKDDGTYRYFFGTESRNLTDHSILVFGLNLFRYPSMGKIPYKKLEILLLPEGQSPDFSEVEGALSNLAQYKSISIFGQPWTFGVAPTEDYKNKIYGVVSHWFNFMTVLVALLFGMTLNRANVARSQNNSLLLLNVSYAKLMEKLAQQNSELSTFAYACSHDLKEPYRMVASFSGLLKTKLEQQFGPDTDEMKFITILNDEGIKAGRLIDDLLEYVACDDPEKKRTYVDLNGLVDDIFSSASHLQHDREMNLTRSELPAISATPVQMLQLFQNLVSNAIKYSKPEGPINISIGTRQLDGETVFFVKDNGIGIPVKFRKKVFGVFKRLSSSSRMKSSGIGLAICEKVVKAYEGTIWISDHTTDGTEFCFTLPEASLAAKS